MRQALKQYFRCDDLHDELLLSGDLSGDAGYFRFGSETLYGQTAVGFRAGRPNDVLYDTAPDVTVSEGGARLPFDPEQVTENLRYERYTERQSRSLAQSVVRSAYYVARPLLPVKVRKHLQKLHLSDWHKLPFPKWPVDTTVDTLQENLLALAIRSRGGEDVPFVWFWPEGANAAAIMTHDVETELGVELSELTMDMDDLSSVPGSFQIVPEERYKVTESYLDSLRVRGFEVNMQGLNHDGHLFEEKEAFKKKAAKINQYAREYGAIGFRSPILYRKQDWFEFFELEYDTSVPNVGHLDPQRGGCCTVMPYFVGKMLELPVTLTQDYSLFHILNDYSLTLWERQIEIITGKHGLINAIVHPDYIIGPKERDTFKGLLDIYSRLRREQNVWLALPREVNSWWRQRAQMRPVFRNGEWQVEGPGSERARVALAKLDRGQLTYKIMLPGGEVSRFSPQRMHVSAI